MGEKIKVTDTTQLPKRLADCQRASGLTELLGVETYLADRFLTRLLGLAWLAKPKRPFALAFPKTRSVHTFGMLFTLDLVWLGENGQVLRIDYDTKPGRIRCCFKANAVVELPGGSNPLNQRTRTKPATAAHSHES